MKTIAAINVTELVNSLFKQGSNRREFAGELTDLALKRYLRAEDELYYAALRTIYDLSGLCGEAGAILAANCGHSNAPSDFILTPGDDLDPIDQELLALRGKMATGLITENDDTIDNAKSRVSAILEDSSRENVRREREYLMGVMDLLICSYVASLAGKSECPETAETNNWEEVKALIPQPTLQDGKMVHPHKLQPESIQVRE